MHYTSEKYWTSKTVTKLEVLFGGINTIRNLHVFVNFLENCRSEHTKDYINLCKHCRKSEVFH